MKIGASKKDVALSHLLQFNCNTNRTHKMENMLQRHVFNREPAFSVYMGLSVYCKTRKEHLVNMLYEHGISISYDRVLAISNAVGESVVSRYVENGVVCPVRLKKGVFTTAAVDNIDHNPTATTATSSFHGTSMSLFQHSPHTGMPQRKVEIPNDKVKKISNLPEYYTNVKPANIKNRQTPLTDILTIPTPRSIDTSSIFLKQEYEWLEEVRVTETVEEAVKVTWYAHHASQVRGHV